MIIKRVFKIFLILTLIFGCGNKAYSKEFIDSFLHIDFSVGFSLFPWSDFLEYERMTSYGFNTTDPSNVSVVYPYQYALNLGLNLDIMPFPTIPVNDETQAIKIGLRVGYKWGFLLQSLTIPTTNDTNDVYGGQLMIYNVILFGPVIYWAPKVEIVGLDAKYKAKGGFTFFALWGFVLEDTASYTAYPSLREKGDSYTTATGTDTGYDTTFTGWKIEVGVGAEITAGTINFGVNLYYSYLDMTLKKQIYVNLPKKTGLHEICIEVYIGIPLQ